MTAYVAQVNTGADQLVASRSVTKPAAVGAGHVGVFFLARWEPSASFPAVTPPSGAVLRGTIATGTLQTLVYLHRVNTETAFAYSWTGTRWSALAAEFFSGVDPVSDLSAAPFQSATGTAAPISTLTVTTITAAALAWHVNTIASSSGITHTPPAGYTETADVAPWSMAYTISTAGGSESAAGATFSPSQIWGAALVALAPASSGATGEAALSATTTLTASGSRGVTGSAALTSTANMSADGLRAAAGSSALAATATLTASGTRSTAGTAALTSTAGMTADGIRGTSGTASLTASSSLDADGIATRTATAALTATSNLTAEPVRSVTGTANLTAGSSLTAVAGRTVHAAAALAADTTLTGAAARIATAEVSLTAESSLTAAAQRITYGSASLTATSTLTAPVEGSAPPVDVTVHVGPLYSHWATGVPYSSAWTVGDPYSSGWEAGAPW